ncbi:streptolysin S family TOMM toxin [Streptococcus equi subsp. equi]|uniref:streptolysin S family TOMM toxin n=1 Tax=Streptococcus equi TaxID=1336 RepID=UPI001E36E9DE|nr:streptolysin S family TOMM toxin [Streptococcus equi]MCD3509943.1 streptolysin S family TOMM toxin [Streptococcus equi subsp. equi]
MLQFASNILATSVAETTQVAPGGCCCCCSCCCCVSASWGNTTINQIMVQLSQSVNFNTSI